MLRYSDGGMAQSLYDHATEFAPDAVHPDIVRGRLARKLSTPRGLLWGGPDGQNAV
jgi:hypothetical protein